MVVPCASTKPRNAPPVRITAAAAAVAVVSAAVTIVVVAVVAIAVPRAATNPHFSFLPFFK